MLEFGSRLDSLEFSDGIVRGGGFMLLTNLRNADAGGDAGHPRTGKRQQSRFPAGASLKCGLRWFWFETGPRNLPGFDQAYFRRFSAHFVPTRFPSGT
jgi:hypothetical protein